MTENHVHFVVGYHIHVNVYMVSCTCSLNYADRRVLTTVLGTGVSSLRHSQTSVHHDVNIDVILEFWTGSYSYDVS